ncbi:hypothetical protein [Myroides marinus]|uniref:Uncharacterized protein n=1 Tax=Myroides marinus TaxID=703342 RepID=A0A164ATR3_9FLAO|nr:hypothetical protein [Myroides marinus]KZE84872.1 hypothetical protein AV926_02550 [Myroides marinus]MDM1348803.1 hypothetical protein [Myroides marinus]MDM1373060.1 hypothetical protein [Myroides marinus]
MKLKTLLPLITLTAQSVFSQNLEYSPSTMSTYFKEFDLAAKENIYLWNTNLYGPILLIDPQTRTIYANEEDIEHTLTQQEDIYKGVLPKSVNIANTAVDWGGKRWAMVMLPLSENRNNRINLLAHESFHRVQPTLGFKLNNTDNNHLDLKEGRVTLRLELEALKQALLAKNIKDVNKHLTAALTFRSYRHSLYSNAANSENGLELNEGIAEFTGLMVSNRSEKEGIDYILKGIDDFFKNPTYIRSFAYHTTPVYGYLLSKRRKEWNKEITDQTLLSDYFIKAFAVALSTDLEKAVASLKKSYNGKLIESEEEIREAQIKEVITNYKRLLIEQPHLEIVFEKMSVSFNPSNIVALEDKGTVYPTMRITDKWGVLVVEQGALMSPNWDRISVSEPTVIEKNKISGKGWTLELKEPYSIEQDKTTLNYKIVRE